MSMKYAAAYLMAVLGGNATPTEKDLKHILSAVGIEAEDEPLNALLKNAKGKCTHEIIANGLKKLQSMPAGGVGGKAAAPASAAKGGEAPAAKVEEKKEEVKEESEDEDMGFSLFD